MKGIFLVVLFLLSPLIIRAAGDILIADFEGKTYGKWKATGTAFGPGPALGGFPNQMKVAGYRGRGLVNSFFNGDRTTGTLTSPPFRIERRNLRFLIGGGMHPGQTCINLRVGGKTVLTATGPNDRPGGSEDLDWMQWDVSPWLGKEATIEIVDTARGGWGHINIDQITLSDAPLPALKPAAREITVAKRYLNMPVKNGAPMRHVIFIVDGAAAREFDIQLADDAPDYWVFLELDAFKGKKATIAVDKLPEDSPALAAIEQADAIKGAESLYYEPLRPQFHFSTRRGWINDPNGMVYSDGEYHLYYQLNPYGWRSGQKHWGHAVSPDMVHWRELPIALHPHTFGDWVYSGSAVVDKDNTGCFKTGPGEVIVAAFTSTGRGECIVTSNDRGRTFTEFEGNPVVVHTGRDPRLFWHAPTRRWVMAVYDEDRAMPRDPDPAADRRKRGGIAFYASPDLRHWEFQSRIAGFYECPDIFELPVDGDKSATKWVLTAASSDYMLGQFDGKKFTPETPLLKGHLGAGFYAAQTFSNTPDGRRIQIGWGQVAAPGMPFNQMMFFPCELTLRTVPATVPSEPRANEGTVPSEARDNEGTVPSEARGLSPAQAVRLCWQPVREIESLRVWKNEWHDLALKPGEDPLAGLKFSSPEVSHILMDIMLEFDPAEARDVTLTVRGVPLIYDCKDKTITCLNKTNPLPPVAGKVRLRLLVDRTSLEIFGNEGSVFMPFPAPFVSNAPALGLGGAGARIKTLEVHELKSAWF